MFIQKLWRYSILVWISVVMLLAQNLPARAQPNVFNGCATIAEIPQAECEALVALYNSTNGSHWTNKLNWLQTNTPCTSPWIGAYCWNSGHVLALHLGTNNLQGTIPSEISQLGQLETLVLFNNKLTGAIPPQISILNNLQDLRLGNNQLSGNIPSTLGQLSKLQFLFLDNNQLSGPIPDTFGNLKKLKKLYAPYNQLSSTIPATIGDMSNLEELYLSGNQLSGAVPASISNLSNLIRLHLSSNMPLTGPLSQTMVNLQKLQWFYFDKTSVCIPTTDVFQAWLHSIELLGPGHLVTNNNPCSVKTIDPNTP